MYHVSVVPYADEYKTLDHAVNRITYLKGIADFVRLGQGKKAARRYEDEIYDTECQLLGLINGLSEDDGSDIDKILFKTDNFGIVSRTEAKNLFLSLNRLN